MAAGARDLLLRNLTRSRERAALVSSAGILTFGALEERAARYAAGLAARGVGRGDRVAVIAANAPEHLVALVGHYLLGAVHVPVNTRYRGEEARHVLLDSGACAAVCDAAGAEVLAECGALPDLRLAIGLGPGAPGTVPLDDLHGTASLPGASDEDTALLIYTSGTTGKSKGVELSYRAVAANIGALTELWRFSPEDRLALALPLFHVHGLGIGLHAVLLHGTTALLHERFEAARVHEAFAREGATLFLGVPTMYVRLLEHLEALPQAAEAFARARLFTAGSAPLPADDFQAFAARTGHAVLERYGMTETLFTLSNPYDGERRPGSVGLPVPGCAVRLVDEEGRDVADGELGEIAVVSSGQMTGYRGLAEETAKSVRDGWFLTGDVARRAADGYVTIEGRRSVDLIKSGGFRIAAREIEDVLRRSPLVADVAVFGAPDRTWGERIAAAVVPTPAGAALSDDALLAALAAACAAVLADFKRPRALVRLPELPRNALGKVQKHLLRPLAG